jgi:hypothetical protein
MSAKACNRCGRGIVFGTEKDTGKVIPLSVGAKVYRVVKDNIVELDPKALIPHVCHTGAAVPAPEPHFSEPKE